jgi:hypothetical protein
MSLILLGLCGCVPIVLGMEFESQWVTSLLLQQLLSFCLLFGNQGVWCWWWRLVAPLSLQAKREDGESRPAVLQERPGQWRARLKPGLCSQAPTPCVKAVPSGWRLLGLLPPPCVWCTCSNPPTAYNTRQPPIPVPARPLSGARVPPLEGILEGGKWREKG